MRTLKLLLLAVSVSLILGCPVPVLQPAKPAPGHIKKAAPSAPPPGQVRRQTNPSGPKPIPPGQRKKMAPEPSPGVVILAPPLPPIVEIEIGVPFFFDGFYYFYEDGGWFYADSPKGKRVKLPKSHHPKDVKFKKGKGKGKGHNK